MATANAQHYDRFYRLLAKSILQEMAESVLCKLEGADSVEDERTVVVGFERK